MVTTVLVLHQLMRALSLPVYATSLKESSNCNGMVDAKDPQLLVQAVVSVA